MKNPFLDIISRFICKDCQLKYIRKLLKTIKLRDDAICVLLNGLVAHTNMRSSQGRFNHHPVFS